MNDPTIMELPDTERDAEMRMDRLMLVLRGDVELDVAREWNGMGVRVGRC